MYCRYYIAYPYNNVTCSEKLFFEHDITPRPLSVSWRSAMCDHRATGRQRAFSFRRRRRTCVYRVTTKYQTRRLLDRRGIIWDFRDVYIIRIVWTRNQRNNNNDNNNMRKIRRFDAVFLRGPSLERCF